LGSGLASLARPALRKSFDCFDAFNFFNIDTFDSWRSSPENSATYSSARLAQALPLSDA
jgi:hypothetical protein